jgi:hypothetical protein
MAGDTGNAGSGGDQPRTVTPEQRAAEREIHAGAEKSGVRIAGLTSVDEHVDSFAGHKDNPVKIGQKTTVRVRVAEDGTLLPRIEDSDASTPPATSILTIQVIPSVEFDSNGDSHVVWNGYARQVDVATTRVFATDRSGPSGAKEKALQSGRPLSEYGNDPAYKDGMLEDMAKSPAEAVTQALTPLVGTGAKLRLGREDRPTRRRSKPGPKTARLAVTVGVPIIIAGIVIGFLAFGGSDSDPSEAPTQAASTETQDPDGGSGESSQQPETPDTPAIEDSDGDVTEPEPAPEPQPTPEPETDANQSSGDALDLATEALEGALDQLPAATVVGGGQLGSSGSFLDQTGPPTGLDFVSLFAVIDGRLVFVLPPGALDGSISIEFDALAADGFTVVSETSLVGSGPSPFWVSDTPHGTLLPIPPIERSSSLPARIGAVVVSDITTAEEFAEVSIWMYRARADGTFDYANTKILWEELAAQNPEFARILGSYVSIFGGTTPIYTAPSAWLGNRP